ncbi:type III pantothenate kinase [Dyadobacter tibetensis]|uniref:type III pantothenate kinase n=1 Tax=Dyadobacter tibetensis TaxID=1211851 RepID=UPI000472A13E|nr:type III pantothenate kinase [Dyadobacter tibetensis]
MTNMVIDAGNTHYKVGIFEHEVLIYNRAGLDLKGVREMIDMYRPEYSIFSSVNIEFEEFMVDIGDIGPIISLSPKIPLPISYHYHTPETLGMDRLAAAVGAQALYPGQDALVIDMGTCITYDWIDGNGVYQGGIISPGMRMRFQAMNRFTKRLPLLEPPREATFLGKSTKESMESGVMNGIIAEAEGIIARYHNISPTMCVVLCGGDAAYFESRLKDTIFVVPQLVLIGLNRILIHNVV